MKLAVLAAGYKLQGRKCVTFEPGDEQDLQFDLLDNATGVRSTCTVWRMLIYM